MELFGITQQYEALGEDIRRAALKALESKQWIGGVAVERFEREAAEFCGCEYAVSCASGTDALTLMLRAAGVGDGDAVFLPALSFAATAEAVVLAGATPVFCEVDDTLTLSPAQLRQEVRRVKREGRLRPAAVLAVDLYGNVADRAELGGICREEGLGFFVDAAQSFGSRVDGVGSLALCDAAAVSFFPTKPLGACGDGGALMTSNGELARRFRSLANHGAGSDKYENTAVGTNSRLDAVQAAILSAKLRALPEELSRRRAAAAAYDKYLPPWIKPIVIKNGVESAFALYTVRFPDEELRDGARAHLNTLGIETGIYYRTPLTLQRAYRRFVSTDTAHQATLCSALLSLPMHGYMSERDAAEVCAALWEVTACDTL